MLEKHGLALAVGTNDHVVKSEREFDDRVEAGKTAVARKHLFHKNARMAGAKHVHKAAASNGTGAQFGGTFNRAHLAALDTFEDGLGLANVFESGIHGFSW